MLLGCSSDGADSADANDDAGKAIGGGGALIASEAASETGSGVWWVRWVNGSPTPPGTSSVSIAGSQGDLLLIAASTECTTTYDIVLTDDALEITDAPDGPCSPFDALLREGSPWILGRGAFNWITLTSGDQRIVLDHVQSDSDPGGGRLATAYRLLQEEVTGGGVELVAVDANGDAIASGEDDRPEIRLVITEDGSGDLAVVTLHSSSGATGGDRSADTACTALSTGSIRLAGVTALPSDLSPELGADGFDGAPPSFTLTPSAINDLEPLSVDLPFLTSVEPCGYSPVIDELFVGQFMLSAGAGSAIVTNSTGSIMQFVAVDPG